VTSAQYARLDRMPANARIVGVDGDCPLVRQPNGCLVRIQPNGRLVAATVLTSRNLGGGRRRPVVAATNSYRDVWS
jgi:hypothetical protein